MNKFFCLVLVGVLTAGCAKAEQGTGRELAVSQNIAQGIWIDVRSPSEFADGHVAGAVNIPVERLTQQIANISTDKTAPINLYCRSGRRAESAYNKLLEMGYQNVVNHGGFDELKNTYATH